MGELRADRMDMYLVERLIILAEECAEVQQSVAKTLRFGLDEMRVKEPFITNREELTHEMGDLLAMIQVMVDYGICTQDELTERARMKHEKMRKWTRWQKDGKVNTDNVIDQ